MHYTTTEPYNSPLYIYMYIVHIYMGIRSYWIELGTFGNFRDIVTLLKYDILYDVETLFFVFKCVTQAFNT